MIFKANHSPFNSIAIQLDKICEFILINTECSESILNLTRISFDYSEDMNFLRYFFKRQANMS